MKLYSIMLVLLSTTAFALPAWRVGDAAVPAPSLRATSIPADSPVAPPSGGVPDAVLSAAADGRYWRASRLMDAHLATLADTTPTLILYTARLNAGWGRWGPVARLLEGRKWLGEVEDGAGWELLARSRIERGQPAAGAEALGHYIAVQESDRDRGVAELRRGLAYAAADENADALAAFERAGRLLPWMSDWSSLFAARTAAAAGDTAALRRHLAGAGALAAGGTWRLRLSAAREAGDSMAAREIALETAQTSAGATRSAAWSELGALRLAAGDTTRARSAFLAAMEDPAALGAVDGARVLTELHPEPDEWRLIADIYARHGNPQRAVRGYTVYLESGRGSEAERRDVRLRLGRAGFAAGRYDEAERGLLELGGSEGVPPAMGAEALYLAGRAQYRQGRGDAGQRTLARLPELFPGEEAVTRGLYLLADLKHDDLEIDEARRFYRQAADASPALNEAGLALMRLGGLDLLDEDYQGAVAVFEEYRRLHPDGRRWAQSTYWAARAYEALGRAADARARLQELRQKDPLSYHGVRAAEILGVPVLQGLSAAPPPAALAPDLVETLASGLRRVDVLSDLEVRGELVREVERLRGAVEGRDAAEYALAEALIERGHTLTAIGIGWDLRRRNGAWNPRLLRIVYPFPFRSMIEPEAQSLKLDPYLVAGLIRQESAFSPAVTSGAGAIGLMQVMPATGGMLAGEAGLRDYDPELLKQPDVNIHFGTRYLATMLERYDGVLPLVLSAYNAGPTRAARWLSLPEARDQELFIERVPYRETRDYIRHVLTNRALYRALYPAPRPAGG